MIGTGMRRPDNRRCASVGAGENTNWTISATTAVIHLDLGMMIPFRSGDEAPAASRQEVWVCDFPNLNMGCMETDRNILVRNAWCYAPNCVN
jgi:hypothetical protein